MPRETQWVWSKILPCMTASEYCRRELEKVMDSSPFVTASTRHRVVQEKIVTTQRHVVLDEKLSHAENSSESSLSWEKHLLS